MIIAALVGVLLLTIVVLRILPKLTANFETRGAQLRHANACMETAFIAASKLMGDRSVPVSVRNFVQWFCSQMAGPGLARNFDADIIASEIRRAAVELGIDADKLAEEVDSLTHEQAHTFGQLVGLGMVTSAYADRQGVVRYTKNWLAATQDSGNASDVTSPKPETCDVRNDDVDVSRIKETICSAGQDEKVLVNPHQEVNFLDDFSESSQPTSPQTAEGRASLYRSKYVPEDSGQSVHADGLGDEQLQIQFVASPRNQTVANSLAPVEASRSGLTIVHLGLSEDRATFGTRSDQIKSQGAGSKKVLARA